MMTTTTVRTTDDELRGSRERLIGLRAQMNLTIDAALAQIERAEEENERLRRDRRLAEMRFYTEAEAAERMHMARGTLQRLRLAGKVQYTALTTDPLYTDEDLAENARRHRKEALSTRRKNG